MNVAFENHVRKENKAEKRERTVQNILTIERRWWYKLCSISWSWRRYQRAEKPCLRRCWVNRLHGIPDFRWWKYRPSACCEFRIRKVEVIEDVVKLNGIVTKTKVKLALVMFELLGMNGWRMRRWLRWLRTGSFRSLKELKLERAKKL